MMKNNARIFKRILRYLALFSFFLTPFPVFSLVAQANGYQLPSLLLLILLIEFVGFFAFAIRCILEQLRRIPAFIVSILLVLFGIGFVVGSFFLLNCTLTNPVYTIILSVTVMILYIFAVRIFKRQYDQILTTGWFLFTSGLNLAILIIAKFTAPNFSDEVMLIVFLFAVAVFAVILNQRGIDVVMDRRGHSASQLPPKIRYYNMILVAVVLVVAVILIIFRTPIVAGAKAALTAIGGVLKRFLLWFGGLFVRKASDEPIEEASEAEPEIDISDIGESGDPLISEIAFIILIALIVLFSIRPVYRKIRSVVSFLVVKFKAWLHRERVFGARKSEENEYYTDTDEMLDRDGSVSEDLSPSRAMRQWKRDVKNFQKMPDSEEKLRCGYRLAVRGLELHGEKIDSGMTQLDILEKARERLSGSAFETATWCYDALVFGGYEDDLKFDSMEESLTQIRSLPVAKK